MNDFVKPIRKEISDEEYIRQLINIKLVKDLTENEIVCPTCHGTGLVVTNNPYDIDGDNTTNVMFPYKHQSIIYCPHCYNGVLSKCRLCGGIIKRGYTKHDCELQQHLDECNRQEKDAHAFDNVPDATTEILNRMEMFYSTIFPYNDGYFADWDTFFDAWDNMLYDGEVSNEIRPVYVWITERIEFHIDADSIIDSATEDMYEDAYTYVTTEKRDELQNYLNSWCESCDIGCAYCVSHKYRVKIPWENYKQ